MSQLLKQKSSPDVSVTGGVGVGVDPVETEPVFETEFSSNSRSPGKIILMEGLEKKTGEAV
jgi:hypothetical protein